MSCVRLAFLTVLLASGVGLAAGARPPAGASVNRVSIAILPAERALGGVSLFKVRVSGVATLARHGLWGKQQRGVFDVLFVFAGQTAPCAGNVYTELSLQTDGQGYQYRVGPGAFSVIVTGFADSSWKYGHFCAYLAPLNSNLSDLGGLPLGAVVARATRAINVHRFGQV
jgi:hypothetical protein